MTNAEKYLKDEISVEEFIKAYLDFSFSRVWEKDENSFENITKKFFEEQTKPLLSKDEKVILKNLSDNFDKISRTDGVLQIRKTTGELAVWHCFCPYSHLFQFIKERRRI